MLRCAQSDRGPRLFYSLQRVIQRHERCVAFTCSLCMFLTNRVILFFSLFILLCFVVRCTHLGDITVPRCRSCYSADLFHLPFYYLLHPIEECNVSHKICTVGLYIRKKTNLKWVSKKFFFFFFKKRSCMASEPSLTITFSKQK